MRRLPAIIIFCFTMVSFVLLPQYGYASSVLVVTIKGEIDDSQVALLHRGASEAKEADAVLVEIDTFGGRVDSATKIRDIISEMSIPTICYVKNRAWSAGALIAISHKYIAMAPGSSIGAAEPIPTTEKTIAALKAEFATTANKTGRDPKIAESMVDKSLGYPGYAEKGQILALTDYQAVNVGYATGVFLSRQEVLTHFGFADATIHEIKENWADQTAAFFSGPLMQTILIAIIFLSVLTEVKTAGMGIAATIGLLAAVAFFTTTFLTGVTGWLGIVLFITGVALVIMEFHMPGVGIFAAGGLVCILASFYLTLGANTSAVYILIASLVVAVIVFLFLVKYLPSSGLWSKLILQNAENSAAGFSSSIDYSIYLGKQGISLTQLRPAGTIELDGEQLDVVTEGRYIQQGVQVKIVQVIGNKIVVRSLK